MSKIEIFAGYVYSNDKVYKNDGFPLSWFMNEDCQSLAYDHCQIDEPNDIVYVKYGVTVIDKIPLSKLERDYAKLRTRI